ncbi:MAG: hypothetical protein ACK5PS_10955 [Desulfopila sp.]
MVQSFAEYGSELYFQLRQYSLERGDEYDKVGNINMGTLGVRVKF